ncbi:general secretion pathway protein F/type IV pilus assembly protein PilC [Rhizobiales bacterium GAS191]|nr:general secretion pathway protein F/type IV pilus assembly protein PilC [Rhizobiales bacterium GAS191]
MPVFHYIAVSPNNERIAGRTVADSVDAAVRALVAQRLTVLRVTPQSWTRRAWELLNRDVTARSKLNSRELVTFAHELGSLIEAGIPVNSALALSINGTRNRMLRSTYETILTHVKEGASIHRALGKLGDRFPGRFTALVEASEETGMLGACLSRAARELQAKQEFADELRNALIYPAFILVTACAAILVLLTVVVPNIETLFGEVGLKNVPAVTRMVIALSHAARALVIPAGILFAVAIVLSVLLRRQDFVRGAVDGFVLRLPFIGRLVSLVETGRLLRVLGELLSGGVSVARALPLAIAAISNRHMRAKLVGARSSLLEGSNLADALDAVGCVPPDAVQVVRVGEKSGKLAELSLQTASVYEHRSRSELKAVTILIGPTLTIVFGLVAGGIIYAVMTTILSLNELAFR